MPRPTLDEVAIHPVIVSALSGTPWVDKAIDAEDVARLIDAGECKRQRDA